MWLTRCEGTCLLGSAELSRHGVNGYPKTNLINAERRMSILIMNVNNRPIIRLKPKYVLIICYCVSEIQLLNISVYGLYGKEDGIKLSSSHH